MAKSTKQIQESITKQIVAALKKGTIPWRRPWTLSLNCGTPMNVISGKNYRGINPMILDLHRQKHTFSTKWYATFNQWRDLGATVMRRPDHVEPGEWGASIIYYSPITKTKEDPRTGEEVEVEYSLLKSYTVFNVEQVILPENLRHLIDIEPASTNEFVDFTPVENLVEATGVEIRYGGNRCYYNRTTDHIQMVQKHRFDSEKNYYSTLLHELAHWSESRCDWTSAYAWCELRAEITSAFLCAELQIPQSEDLTNHCAYVESWCQGLKSAPHFVFKTSAAASKAVDYLLSFVRHPELIEF